MLTGRGRARIRAPRRLGLGSSEAIDFDTMWEILSSSLREIHTKNASKLSFEELYRNAYKLVLKKKGEPLYFKVKEFEESWLANEVYPRIINDLSPGLFIDYTKATAAAVTIEKRLAGEKLLRSLKLAWEDHNLCMNMTTDVLMYMDRVYCTDSKNPSIFTASMGQFRDFVLRAAIPGQNQMTLAEVMNSVILDQIQMEREGDIIDTSLIRSCIYMLEGLYETENEDESTKLYLTSFEPAFLAASEAFYENEGNLLLSQVDAGTFCRHAKRRAIEEQKRCRSTLSMLSSAKIKSVFEEKFIKKNIREVIALESSGVRCMLDNDRLDELEMVYDLISRVDPKKEDLKQAVQKRITELGNEINSAAIVIQKHSVPKSNNSTEDKPERDSKAPSEKPMNQQTVVAIKWVDEILQLKGKFDDILAKAFQSDQGLQSAFSRSYAGFINAFERNSEHISLFFDENLKKGIKGKTENEVDTLLDQGIILLRYVQDKDLFERYYKKHLSRRLLMKRSANMDAERHMITKMKMEVGNNFTQKIEAMFKDMAVSEDLTSSFKNHGTQLEDPGSNRTELEVNILTSTMWPLESMGPSYQEGESKSHCIFPSQIDKVKQRFENFYLNKHSGRQLRWQAHMGTADLRAYFPQMKGSKKTRELNVSTYAMLILLLFNDLPPGESYTCEEIQAKTNIPFIELTRNLQSLAVAPKTRILIKEPMSKDVKSDDKFFFNESFFSQFQRVKIGVVTSNNRVEDVNERKQTEQKNNDTRGGSIEAAIVRIMKQRKELSHSGLVTEVIQQLTARFLPDVAMVKKKIESLIERDYLERIEDQDPPAYRYRA